jgi:hypothetical protein
MPVTHVNRYRDTYYLQVGRTKTGKPRYWFAKSAEGDLVDVIPEGFEVYENPDARVYLRKIVPQIVTPEEVAVVRESAGGASDRFSRKRPETALVPAGPDRWRACR